MCNKLPDAVHCWTHNLETAARLRTLFGCHGEAVADAKTLSIIETTLGRKISAIIVASPRLRQRIERITSDIDPDPLILTQQPNSN